MSVPPESLTKTLILALTQSQALQHQADEGLKTIERLTRENEELKQEVNVLRRKQDDTPNLSAQFDQLFRQDAEKQAEIDGLKAELRLVQVKERKRRLRNPSTSSPAVSPGEAEAKATSKNTYRKRSRSTSPEALKEISSNLPAGENAPGHRHRFKRFSDRTAGAIPTVAEDGDDYNSPQADPVPVKQTGTKEAVSPRQRLQALLSASAPTTPVLPSPRETDSTSLRAAPLSDQAKPPMLLSTTDCTVSAASKTTSVRKPPFLPLKPRAVAPPAPEDEEPYRSRPIHRLNLSHFKINPAYNGGLDYAYTDVVRGRDAKKCLPGCTRPECCGGRFRALADTLPLEKNISDDDLLLEFLGPGSEAKIRTLTALARTNLVHEARAKRLANLYGRMHRASFERAQSPPGFWNTDFPSTQEDADNREQARLRERDEVEKRHQEAKQGNGRWLFADE